MDEKDRDLLIRAYKAEKDHLIGNRIHAVCMVKINGLKISEVASLCYCDSRTVSGWVRRFDKDGLAGLKDRPRSGRPPRVALKKIRKIIAGGGGITTPRMLKNTIREKHGVEYHITNVRKIMRRLGMSAKTSQAVHAGRAEMEEIREWQRDTKRQIAYLKSRGFVTAVVDESIFINDPGSGVKYWSQRGVPVITAYNGSHDKIVAYGALTTDGRQFVRTYEGFNKETFLKYLKALVGHFGRTAIIMDNAPQHKARIVREYLEGEPNARIMWLPRATPELSVVEEYWHQSKRDLLVSEYYSTVVHMRRALSEYFRTARPKLDAMKFINRTSLPCKNF